MVLQEEVLSNKCETVQNELTFRKTLHWYGFCSRHHPVSLKISQEHHLFSVWGVFVGTLCSYAMLHALVQQKEKLSYQWKWQALSFLSGVLSPSHWKVRLHAPHPLFTCLPQSCLPPTKKKPTVKNSLKANKNYWVPKKVRHIKLFIIYFCNESGCDSSSQKFSTGWNFTALKIFEHHKNCS